LILRTLLVATCALLLTVLPGPGATALEAQQPTVQVVIPPEGVTQELVLRDGSTLFGRVVETGDPFRFELASGQVLEFRIADVRRISGARGRVVDGTFWRSDPNQTRLFFGPTARTLPAGDGYLSVFELIFPIVAVGVHDRVTLAGGTPLLFGSGQSGHPFWFAPKVGLVQGDQIELAAGVLALFGTGSSESFGILYGIASIGDPDGGAHIGAGWGYDRGDLASQPALMFGGEARIGPSVKLLTENYLFPSDGGIVSGGVRFFGERLSADLGLAMPVGDGTGTFIFPVVNFSWSW
jgi:hypothetical protein